MSLGQNSDNPWLSLDNVTLSLFPASKKLQSLQEQLQVIVVNDFGAGVVKTLEEDFGHIDIVIRAVFIQIA